MPGDRSAGRLPLNEPTLTMLQRWLHRQKTPMGLAKRAQAMLRLSEGKSVRVTAQEVGLTKRQVYKWGKRFGQFGLEGLVDRPRSGRKPVFSPEVALYVVKLACERPEQHGVSISKREKCTLSR